ncbi:MAG: hypothetical protein ACRCT8_16600 [Lacipirellulaceae bacterium]
MNNELLARKPLLSFRTMLPYVPGQVLENVLGFDAAIYTANPLFWRMVGAPWPGLAPWWQNPRWTGVALLQEWWRELEDLVDAFPSFRFNVFVQHKRPDYFESDRASEWQEWLRPYYRYTLAGHQQAALERLERLAAEKAIVVYASPAFHLREQLWRAARDREVIERSNFCQPTKLAGHKKYTYCEPGSSGKGHSESSDIECFDFYNRFNVLLEVDATSQSNIEFLVETGQIVQEAVGTVAGLTDSYSEIFDSIAGAENNPFSRAMASITAFVFVSGVRWSVCYDPRRMVASR